MDNEVVQQTLYWAADHVRVWAPAVVIGLAGVVIGCGHLMATALKANR